MSDATALPRIRLLHRLAFALRRPQPDLSVLRPHVLRDIGLTADQARRTAARPLWDAPETWLQRD